MKRIIIFLLVFSFLLNIQTGCTQGKNTSVNEQIISVFKSSNSNILTSSLKAWGEIKKQIKDKKEFNAISKEVIEELGVINDSSLEVKQDYSDTCMQTYIRGIRKDNSIITAKFESLLNEPNLQENYLTIDFSYDGEYNLDYFEKIINGIYQKFEVAPNFNSSVCGTIDGKFTKEKMDSMEKEILEFFDARYIEGIRQGELLSVSAYSEGIERRIKVGNKLINVNFALRYNEDEDKTYMYIATPIIVSEY